MTQLNTLKSLIVTALGSDSAIEQYCQDTFTKSITVLVGVDANKPPKADDTVPYVAITQGKRARESNGEYMGHELMITTVINDDGVTTATVGNATVTTFDGAETLEGLHELVEKCVSKTLWRNGYPLQQAPDLPDTAPADTYPYFSATTTYQVRVSNPIPL